VIADGFLWLTARAPAVRRHLWRGLFELVAYYFSHAEFWTFMNYGYAPEPGEAMPKLDGVDWAQRYPVYLYHRIAGRVDLHGRDVLEVGSGRGGGASYVKRYLKPRRMVGLDIAAGAIAFCRRVHDVPGLEFLEGDACALPFPDSTFDAVINVESSFCYPSLDQFFAEVHRVLRPQGHFLYADLHGPDDDDALEQRLAASGLVLIEKSDITQNVATALHLDSAHRSRSGDRLCPALLRKPFDVFLGVAGTRIPVQLGDGRLRYLAYVLTRNH
jgi:SAM-dependent methyltransferase